MIGHTVAFDRTRKQGQAHLDFVVLTCTAVPQLASGISAGTLTQATMTAPDHFKGVEIAHVAAYVGNYQEQLARASVVTLFSFFEAYVRELLAEIVAFHGDDKAFIATADRRTRAFLSSPPAAILAAKRKLQEPAKKAKADKYRKYTEQLKKGGFRFPSELMASTGVRLLIKKASAKGFKAWEIPDILEDVLHFPLLMTDRTRLTNIRDLRNDIAHGTSLKVAIKDATAVGASLHTLAAKIDRHAVEHFFVLEKYA